MKRLILSAVILTLSLGVALAEEVKGRITKIDDKTVTITNKDNKDGKTYDIAKDVKVCKMVKDAKEALADGLKSEELKDLPRPVEAFERNLSLISPRQDFGYARVKYLRNPSKNL